MLNRKLVRSELNRKLERTEASGTVVEVFFYDTKDRSRRKATRKATGTSVLQSTSQSWGGADDLEEQRARVLRGPAPCFVIPGLHLGRRLRCPGSEPVPICIAHSPTFQRQTSRKTSPDIPACGGGKGEGVPNFLCGGHDESSSLAAF